MRSRYWPALPGLFLSILPAFSQGVITTVAGTDWQFPGDGRPAVNAPLGGTFGLDVAAGPEGSFYIADADNFMVMRAGPDGILSVVAGNGILGFSGDGGLAVNASIGFPVAVAVDPSSNVYIAVGDLVHRVTPDGIIKIYAGTGSSGFDGDGGPANRARLNQPSGLAVDASGSLYISDKLNNRIRKVTPDGVISTIAGTGPAGYTGDGGRAAAAALSAPTRIALDSGGNLYFVDYGNNRVRRITRDGLISTVAGGSAGLDDGIAATSANLLPINVAVDQAGNLFIGDYRSRKIRRVDRSGVLTSVAGNGEAGFSGDGGPASGAAINFIFGGLSAGAGGDLYLADNENFRIRRIADGLIRTVAGNGLFRFSGNGGPATSATLFVPGGVAVDRDGNIYFTEQTLNRIRKITPDGLVSVVGGSGMLGYSGDGGPATEAALEIPTFVTTDPAGDIYFSDTINNVIRRIGRTGIITTIAGNGRNDFSGDRGPATRASLGGPNGIDFDDAGNLYISDTGNNRIRKVAPDGTISTIAGTGAAGFLGDNGPALQARLNGPTGLRVSGGSIYFADTQNHRVRRIDPGGVITTVAGNGQMGFSGDGGQAASASLNGPHGLAFDKAGVLYIADQANYVVRRVASDGVITTFAGQGGLSGYSGDGGPAKSARLLSPNDLAFDAAGNLLISDLGNHRIRAVLNAAPTYKVNPEILVLTAPAGSKPVDLTLDVVGSIPGIPFIAAGYAPDGWLSASPSAGSMPSTLRVTIDPSALAPDIYLGAVGVSASNAETAFTGIYVLLTVTAPGDPSLDVKTTALKYAFVQGGAGLTKVLPIANGGGGSLNFAVTTDTSSGGAWLRAQAATGTIDAFGAAAVSISANPAGLPPGTYSGTVYVANKEPLQIVTVPVTMTVTAVPLSILVPQTGLTFFAVQGSTAVAPQSFSVLNTGQGQMRFTASASTISGGPWLSIFPGAGVSDADSPVVPQVRVDANPQGLNAGIYYGSVQVSAPGAGNSPQFVSVVLNVLSPGSTIGPLVQPAALIFAASVGESPGSQTVLVQNTSSSPVTFRSGRVTTDGANWLTTLPTDATVTQAQPVRIVVQPLTAGLAPGIYRGTLTLAFSDGNTRNIALVLVIVAQGSSLLSSKPVREAEGCAPTRLAPVFTQLSDGFSIPAGFPNQVSVKVIDDCANPMITGSVVVNFNNGDPAIGLTSLKDGSWAGTWIPYRSVSEPIITANAQIPELNLKGDVQIKGGFRILDPPPVVRAGAILNGASYVEQAPLAPGSLFVVLGSKLAQSEASASTLPLPANLAGSAILFAGREAPLVSASDGQMVAVIPYGIGANTTQQVVITRGNSLSAPQPVTIAAAAPGIFTQDGSGKGRGNIFALDASGAQTLADASHPVKAGDTIVIYCTGLGEVTPPVPAGSPVSQMSSTINPVAVSIGGVAANVTFSGVAPGGPAGSYQVKTVVPNGVAAGDQVPVVVTAAGQSSQPVTVATR
jgi:uncharacterized protein (TIGR03437 family)